MESKIQFFQSNALFLLTLYYHITAKEQRKKLKENSKLSLLRGCLDKISVHVRRKALPEQIKRGSTGSMLQEHFMISGTFESETYTNKQPDLVINKIYEY